jgi:TRAP-type mannitol/chloroaromatic compound transport system substrate-binding protein
MDANLVLAWHYYGGGRALLEEVYKDLNLDVVSFLYGPMPTQPLGWFKKPIAGPADFKGLKYRAAGLSVDIFAKLGAAVSALPGGDIVAAMDKGLIDAAEFNNATSDRLLGLPDAAKICMLQSYHQPGEQFEILFNRKRYDSLPGELKAILRYAVEAASADMSWKAAYRYANDYFELRTRDNVRFDKTPDTILQAQLAAWDEVAAKKSEENPHFKRIYESQREFAERVVRWQHDTTVDSRLAYDHFFGNRKA